METQLTTTSATDIVPISSQGLSPYDMRRDEQRFPRLRHITAVDAIAQISQVIVHAAMLRGTRIVAEDIATIAAGLHHEMMLDEDKLGTDNVSAAELDYAVRRAILRGDEIYGINVASLYKIVTGYIKTEGTLAHRRILAERDAANRKAAESSPVNIALQAKAAGLAKQKGIH